MWWQLALPQEPKLGWICPRCSSCWLTSPFCLSRWCLRQSRKWGVVSGGGLHGGHTNDNMALSNQQKPRVAGGCLSAFRAQSNSAVLCCGLYCQRKWSVNAGSLWSPCTRVLYCKNSTYILASFVCCCSIYVSFFFSFPFLFLLFDIIKITIVTHDSVLISSEIWQLLVVG